MPFLPHRQRRTSPQCTQSRILLTSVAAIVVAALLHLAPHAIDNDVYLPDYAQREADAAALLGVRRSNLSAGDAWLYTMCDTCRPAEVGVTPAKIVALVELRNVADSLTSFLDALEPLVDGVVALDDGSTDGTRALLFERCVRTSVERCKLDALIARRGRWVRQELRDRQLLLNVARAVGGTHMVLLDYDERLACAGADGLAEAQHSIRKLKAGHSMYVPWVEVWKHPGVQRVLPDDRHMNFLVRRQTVIFADDGRAAYTAESTGAHALGAAGGSATIHALRCPRTVCGRPPRYAGAGTPFGNDARVHRAPAGCVLLETRFLHIANVLLKAAWYEALGRVMGAPAAATHGKMLDALFPQAGGGRVALAASDAWVDADAMRTMSRQRRIERWRAAQLVGWLQTLGDAQLDDLPSLRAVDSNALRTADAAVRLRPLRGWVHLPRIKRGTLLVVLDDDDDVVQLASIATLLGGGPAWDIDVRNIALRAATILGDSTNIDARTLEYEDWRTSVVDKLSATLAKSPTNATYLRAQLGTPHFDALLNFVSGELPDYHVIFLLAVDAARPLSDAAAGRLRMLMEVSKMAASHVRLLAVDAGALGSYATLTYLRRRIAGDDGVEAERSALLQAAERMHSRLRKGRVDGLQPVARLVFSLNVGRSGSKYLAGLFASLGYGVRAEHEPRCPEGLCSGGGAMAMQNVRLNATYDARRRVKVAMIDTAVANIPHNGGDAATTMSGGGFGGSCAEMTSMIRGGRLGDMVVDISSAAGCITRRVRPFVYAETNANFKSWFYDVTLDHYPVRGYNVSVVVLRKYHAATLKSLLETGYFNVRDGYKWMETANGVNARIRSIAADKQLDAIDKIISYLFNAEAVMRWIIRQYNPSVTFIEERAEIMYTRRGALDLMRRLNLQATPSTMRLAGVRADKYGEGDRKRARVVPATLEECEERVRRYVMACIKRGIELPHHMQQLERVPV